MRYPYFVRCAVCHTRLDTRRVAAQPDGRYRCATCQAFADRLAAAREATAAQLSTEREA